MKKPSSRSLLAVSGAILFAGLGLTVFRAPSNISPLAFAETKGKVHLDPETVKSLALLKAVSGFVSENYVDPVSEKQLYENALNGMVERLDPHSSYLDPQQLKDMRDDLGSHFGGIGLQVQKYKEFIRVASVLKDTPSEKAGVKQGDLILEADHKSLSGKSLEEAVRFLRGPTGTHVVLTILRPSLGKKIQIRVTRHKIKMQRVFSRIDGDLIYLRLSEFTDKVNNTLKHEFFKLYDEMKAKGITPHGVIFDLRSNPGGRLDQAVAVARDFISTGKIVSVRGRDKKQDTTWSANNTAIIGNLPLVVLINEDSASASEIVAGAIQDHRRGLLVGERTFGKGSVQTVIPLEGHGALRLTTARYYTPLDRSIQGEGIKPDITVGLTSSANDDGSYHESDLAFALPHQNDNQPQHKLPALPKSLTVQLKSFAHNPSKTWPKLEFNKPETDFQLHQAEELLHHADLKSLS